MGDRFERARARMVGVLLAMGLLGGLGAFIPPALPASASVVPAVQGTVSDGTNPVAGIAVSVFGATFGDLVGSATTGTTGAFNIPATPGLTVKVRFDDPTFIWAQAFNGGAANWDSAPPLVVPPNGVLQVDAALVPFHGSIAGTAFDSTGAPLPSVRVEAYNAVYGNVVSSAATNAVGQYQFDGLNPARYRLRFTDEFGQRASLWNGGAATFAAAADISVASNERVNVDETLPVGGVITGAVTAGSGSAPIAGLYVIALTTTPPITVMQVRSTAWNGTYSLTQLPTGSYKVGFLDITNLQNPAVGLRPVMYPNLDVVSLGLTAAFNASPAVAVTAGNTTLANASTVGIDCASTMSSIDLTGANLSSKNLTGCTLTDDLLTGANLTATNFYGADLTGSTLTNVVSTGSALGFATLQGVRSGGMVGAPVSLPSGWNMRSGYLVGAGADLSSAVLPGVDLSWMDISRTNFTDADLANASLIGTSLSGAQLVRTNLAGANLQSSDLSGVTIDGADLTHANLRYANVNGATFRNPVLVGTRSGSMAGTPASLPADAAIVSGYLLAPSVDLSSENLTGFDLGGRDLTGADLNGSTLIGVNITATVLAGADLRAVRSGGVIGTPQSLPLGWRLINGYLIGPYANLVNAQLANLDLSNTDLTGAWLSGSDLNDATLAGATMTGVLGISIIGTPASLPSRWVLLHGDLIGPGANLEYMSFVNWDLSGLDLTGANLAYTQLTGARIQGTTLTDATLTGVSTGGLTGTPAALPANWTYLAGYLVGPSANLTGANLAGCDLSGVNLTNTTLTGVSSGGLTGTPIGLPSPWVIRKGFLIGPGANLTDADLSFANLSNTDLGGANLIRANLTFANLTNTVLREAHLEAANLAYANVAGADLVAFFSTVRSGLMRGTPAYIAYGYSLTDGYIIGPWVNLDFANLSGVDLTGRDLIGTTLTYANLAGANFIGVTGNPYAGGASYSAASPTVCPDTTIAPTQTPTCAGHGFAS